MTGVRTSVRRQAVRRRTAILAFLAVMGPGLITGFAGNDAGGVTTYTAVGAHYGYSMLWLLVLSTIGLMVIQEMCARMGAVTGKGLSDLIRERFGVGWTAVAMLALLIRTGANRAEYADRREPRDAGRRAHRAVPIAGVVIWSLVSSPGYNVVLGGLCWCRKVAYPLARSSSSAWASWARLAIRPSDRQRRCRSLADRRRQPATCVILQRQRGQSTGGAVPLRAGRRAVRRLLTG